MDRIEGPYTSGTGRLTDERLIIVGGLVNLNIFEGYHSGPEKS